MNINSKKLLIYHHVSFKAILKSSSVFSFFSDIVLCIYMNLLIYIMIAHPHIFNFGKKAGQHISLHTHQCMHYHTHFTMPHRMIPCIFTCSCTA